MFRFWRFLRGAASLRRFHAGAKIVADETGKPRRVALLEGFNGCLNHVFLRDVIPRNGKAVFIGKMVNKFALRAPVALAERMEGIDVAKI
jgi:hypothetical protein